MKIFSSCSLKVSSVTCVFNSVNLHLDVGCLRTLICGMVDHQIKSLVTIKVKLSSLGVELI